MGIAFIVIGSLIGLVVLIVKLVRMNRANEIKNWKVGDKLILDNLQLKHELSTNKSDYAILSGWNMDEVIVDMGSDYVKIISHSDIDENKSMKWRLVYDRCERKMDGQKPQFSSEVGKSKNDLKIDGKDIDLLNETELKVQLDISLKHEKYELAEIIRKKLEKFR